MADEGHPRPETTKYFASPARVERAFPAEPTSVGAARAFTRATLTGWGLTRPVVDDATLVVSELITNVLRHARTPVLLAVQLRGGQLDVELTDGEPSGPASRQADEEDEGGRGMQIVDTLTAAWGTAPSPVGKTVWARLPAGSGTGPPAPPAQREAPSAPRNTPA